MILLKLTTTQGQEAMISMGHIRIIEAMGGYTVVTVAVGQAARRIEVEETPQEILVKMKAADEWRDAHA